MTESTHEIWSNEEIDLIIADYFEMLAQELSGAPYVKAHRNTALRQLTGRTRGSIERKHQNISAVLVRLGLPWISGYKPLSNFQNALIAGVERFLEGRPDVIGVQPAVANRSVNESNGLWIGPPPECQREEAQDDPPALLRLVRKFDPAQRDARNRALGRQGEQIVFDRERLVLQRVGRDDLASRVRWISEEDGDGAGYDILSFDERGEERLLEVKTTVGGATTPFFLTENERALSEERRDAFRLIRIYDFVRRPSAFELVPPLVNWVTLRPTNYRAGFE